MAHDPQRMNCRECLVPQETWSVICFAVKELVKAGEESNLSSRSHKGLNRES
jgi:hypothetical protein